MEWNVRALLMNGETVDIRIRASYRELAIKMVYAILEAMGHEKHDVNWLSYLQGDKYESL